ncbi:hypothetical protein TNCT_595851 [Trichonephila clavata]|uniref:Uncharacterized protein n=1 Tax=Trichonephila clavata TaxID=2740835 RepID=A0A8X6G9M7_TRICU|nr:hypothetical protein TNCT_595851 [Trichonephila clavata]
MAERPPRKARKSMNNPGNGDERYSNTNPSSNISTISNQPKNQARKSTGTRRTGSNSAELNESNEVI